MVTECPVCQESVVFEVQQVCDHSEVVCASCLTSFSLKVILEAVETEADVLSPSCGFDAPAEEIEALIEQVPLERAIMGEEEPSEPVKKVLLCLEGEATRELVSALLEPENIHIIDIPSEMDALVSADCPSPDIALIDVDLKRSTEDDLCAGIRENPVFKNSKIIVIGSMFEKNTRYRQEEPAFPGADDFIDRYYLQKELLGKILNQAEAVSEDISSALELSPAVELSPVVEVPPVSERSFDENAGDVPCEVEFEGEALEGVEVARDEDISEESPEKAVQIARNVISDMMHCNEEKVEEGIRSGQFYDFLMDEIGESRREYETQVSEATRAVSNYFEDILEEKIQERKAAQEIVEPVEAESPLDFGTSEDVFVDEGEAMSSDFSGESLDVFEATALADAPMAELELADSLKTTETEKITETDAPDSEGFESDLSTSPDSQDQGDLMSFSLSTEDTPEFEESLAGFETSLVFDEAPLNEGLADEGLIDENLLDDEAFSAPPDELPTEIQSSQPLDLAEEVFGEAAVIPEASVFGDAIGDVMEEESPAVKTAKRLARIIVSDIVIYNEKKVEKGLQNGQFFELLNEEIDEGRQLYHSRVDKDGLERDYLQEALEDYVSKKTSVSSG